MTHTERGRKGPKNLLPAPGVILTNGFEDVKRVTFDLCGGQQFDSKFLLKLSLLFRDFVVISPHWSLDYPHHLNCAAFCFLTEIKERNESEKHV